MGDTIDYLLSSSPTDWSAVQQTIEQNPTDILWVSSGEDTVLHFACVNEAPIDVFTFLVEKHRTAVRSKNIHGWLPLHSACIYSPFLDVINLLINEYPDGLVVKTYDGRTPLQLAEVHGNVTIVDYLKTFPVDRLKTSQAEGRITSMVDVQEKDLEEDIELVIEKVIDNDYCEDDFVSGDHNRDSVKTRLPEKHSPAVVQIKLKTLEEDLKERKIAFKASNETTDVKDTLSNSAIAAELKDLKNSFSVMAMNLKELFVAMDNLKRQMNAVSSVPSDQAVTMTERKLANPDWQTLLVEKLEKYEERCAVVETYQKALKKEFQNTNKKIELDIMNLISAITAESEKNNKSIEEKLALNVQLTKWQYISCCLVGTAAFSSTSIFFSNPKNCNSMTGIENIASLNNHDNVKYNLMSSCLVLLQSISHWIMTKSPIIISSAIVFTIIPSKLTKQSSIMSWDSNKYTSAFCQSGLKICITTLKFVKHYCNVSLNRLEEIHESLKKPITSKLN